MSAEASPKLWLPDEWVDESIPFPRASPDAWIGARSDGTVVLIGCYDGPLGENTDAEEAGDDPPWGSPRPLDDGETVCFSSTRQCGKAVLTVNDDGTWSVDTPMPPDATHVWVLWDHETSTDSVEALMAETDYLKGEPGDHAIEYYEWTEGTPFVFDAGTRRFLAKGAPS